MIKTETNVFSLSSIRNKEKRFVVRLSVSRRVILSFTFAAFRFSIDVNSEKKNRTLENSVGIDRTPQNGNVVPNVSFSDQCKSAVPSFQIEYLESTSIEPKANVAERVKATRVLCSNGSFVFFFFCFFSFSFSSLNRIK